MKPTKLLIIVALALLSAALPAQEGSHFAAGWNIDKFFNTKALQLIVNDFNSHYSGNGFTLQQPLQAPNTLNGIFLGLKYQNDMVVMGIDLHSHYARSIAKYTDASNLPFTRQLRVTRSGFAMGFGWYLVHEKQFRMGPLFYLCAEQLMISTRWSARWIEPDKDMPIDVFYFSSMIKYPISVGGKSFQFDLIPYLQLPFYRIKLAKLNNNLNEGYAKVYDESDMKMRMMSYGLIITLNFRKKKY